MSDKNTLAADLAAAFPEVIKTKKLAAEIIDSVLGSIAAGLKGGGEVRLHGFGAFAAKAVPARTGRNPRTGEEIQIAAGSALKFKPAKALKDALA